MNKRNVALRDELVLLKDELEKGYVPSREICDSVRKMLTDYILYLQSNAFEQQEQSDRIEASVKIEFCDVSSEHITDPEMLSGIEANDNNIAYLFDLALKKVIKVTDDTTSKYRSLVDGKYVVPISILNDGDKTDYYIMTSKGWDCFNRKNIVARFKEKSKVVIPEKLRISSAVLDSSGFMRCVNLLEYYEKMGKKDYMIFSFSNNFDMLVGTEISSSLDVKYEIAWDAEIENVNDLLILLHKICKSEDVNSVTSIVRTDAEKKQIIKQIGQDYIISNKIDYYVLEG